MSSGSASESDSQSISSTKSNDSSSLEFIITHVFLPVKPPKVDDYSLEKDLQLLRAVCTAAHAYTAHVSGPSELQWLSITKMLDNLQASVQSRMDKDLISLQLDGMSTGDVLTFFIRSCNTALIIRKQDDRVLCEPFKVSPSEDALKKTGRPLTCHYPDSTIEIPKEVFVGAEYQSKLASSLSFPDVDAIDSHRPLPFVFSNLLLGVGQMVDIPPITKRIRDDVRDDVLEDLSDGTHEHEEIARLDAWRRSSLWLLIRIAIQTSFNRSLPEPHLYKQLMLFFLCAFARDENNVNLSDDLVHLMACKILRRLSKLGSSVPEWLSEMAFETCSRLREILDARKEHSTRPSAFRNPSQGELARDSDSFLPNLDNHVRDKLANREQNHFGSPFQPDHRPRGTMEDYLSSNGTFFTEACSVNENLTLCGVEELIEQGIDDWVANVTNVDQACSQIEFLMDKYMERKLEDQSGYFGDSLYNSISILTGIELFVAVDKLVLREIPMLADYSPEIPLRILETLLLHKRSSFHHLSRAYQYLFARHSRSRPGWSVLSDMFTQDSFPVRYYDQSGDLQHLKTCIEAGMGRLPNSPLLARVVVFELQCPTSVRVWRSAVIRILFYFYELEDYVDDWDLLWPAEPAEKEILFTIPPKLWYYLVSHAKPSLRVQFSACFYPEDRPQNDPILYYAIQFSNELSCKLSRWRLVYHETRHFPMRFLSAVSHDQAFDESRVLEKYASFTSHTSNKVLAAQARCPPFLSLDEFVAFAHLRTDGSLQWFNILQGLRTKKINLRRPEAHYLLRHAALQAGPLDLNTGEWIWHEELQDSLFCHALLDELESLFVDAAAGSIDHILMSTMSLLLTRIVETTPNDGVFDRSIFLLRGIRSKTLNWVEELSYNLAMSPSDAERGSLLLDMAATCRSTFDVGLVSLPKLLCSAEDVDAILSCTLLVYILYSHFLAPRLLTRLLNPNHRTSPTLEDFLKDAILADPSEYGIDLAVRKVFGFYQPGTQRWEPLLYPSGRWMKCTHRVITRPSQIVHVNLLTGEIRVDGRRLPNLRSLASHSSMSEQLEIIFRDQGFFLIPSNLPGMDFTTHVIQPRHRVHFSVRGDGLLVQAQCSHTQNILELIPWEKVKNDLPPALVRRHVHWLDMSKKTIEIRPFERIWESSSEHWRIDIALPGRYRVYKGHETLVDIRSPTWAMISRCFRCLHYYDKHCPNSSDDMLITTSPIDSLQALRLFVTLSRYGLSFFVNAQGELESCDFMAMVYDENQEIGTLFGLESLLVLRPRTHVSNTSTLIPEGLIPRRVLIPNGWFKWDSSDTTRISIQGASSWCHVYDVDVELGSLNADGNVGSMEFLARTHDITCNYWPDPLTCKPGSEAALCILRSGACRSLMKPNPLCDHGPDSLQPRALAVYNEIRRRYYWNAGPWDGWSVSVPSLERVMQRAVHPLLRHHYYDDDDRFKEHVLSQMSLHDLLSSRQAPTLSTRTFLPRNTGKEISHDTHKLSLKSLFSSLPMSRTDPIFRREYIALLEKSAAQNAREDSALRIGYGFQTSSNDRVRPLQEYYAKCESKYFNSLKILQNHLSPTTNSFEQALQQFGWWPAITGESLLGCLASASPSATQITSSWKKCLTSLALLLLDLQHSRRLLRLALHGPEEEFLRELENEPCDGWDPEKYPDWLLIQIQGNFLIRRVQAGTAIEMMFPPSGKNAVMQVNMGEGKSSVIIPIVAAALADGKQLVRVVVPKALTMQMFETLVARLGGLANRPVYYLPFTRNSERELTASKLHELMTQCMNERGILLVEPAHVTSLKLKNIEKQIPDKKLVGLLADHRLLKLAHDLKHAASEMGANPVDVHQVDHDEDGDESANSSDTLDTAQKWIDLQNWIDSNARDILDESDEVLHTRNQFIYTIGYQQHIDGHPDRWIIIQQVLALLKDCAHILSRNHQNSMEYELGSPGSFPHIRIVLSSDVSRRLVSQVVEDVMGGGLRIPDLSFQDIPQALCDAIRAFISKENVLPGTAKMVKDYAENSKNIRLWNGLLLLRGLLASDGMLLYALAERRWRIDYGLVPNGTPTLLAVPYRAKDMPAPDTQFGHSDITIILTCLSYYYAGLTEDQLRTTFETLLDEDDPHTEYAHWKDHGPEYNFQPLPLSLQNLRDINLRPSEEWDKVTFPRFARNQAAINFYLSRVVFPKEAHGFQWKLCTSSWDLAEEREKPITGFSGTNDGQWLLPMSILQRDLDYQKGTNAKILSYLLLPENNFYVAVHHGNERCNTSQLLQIVANQQPQIRVLLDVGGQVLDLSNLQLAKEWLNIDRDAFGAVYFDDDRLMVYMRSGAELPLLSSPLSQQLERCVVYLDQAHTRGTDLKLPNESRAAVTLGPRLTKDNLVQGCMRMRKLGQPKGHSVVFLAPLEVDSSIRTVTGKKDPSIPIASVDVLYWTIRETWDDIQRRAPYWAQQGMSHRSRHEAWSHFRKGDITAEKLSDSWLEPERKSLNDLYAPSQLESSTNSLPALDPDILERCETLGVSSRSTGTAKLAEEQEREVNRERERERQVELPPEAKPAKHSLHPDVIGFVNTGVLPPVHLGSAFIPVFTMFEKSTAATTRNANVIQWSPSILATADFCRTIEPNSTHGGMDQYLRPVQWILSRRNNEGYVLVVLSPFEVAQMLPAIKASAHVHLHLYAPRTAERIKPSDDLRLYTIPPLPSDWTPPWFLIDQLNIFAGQLYLRDYQTYLRLCHFLGVPTTDSPRSRETSWNRSHIRGNSEGDEIRNSPLPFVNALLRIRSRGQPFGHTHMGKILRGQVLSEKDFKRIPDHRDTYHTTSDRGNDVPIPSDHVGYDVIPLKNGAESSRKRRLEIDVISGVDSGEPGKRPRRGYWETVLSPSPSDVLS